MKEALAKARGALDAIERYIDEGKYAEAKTKSLMTGAQVDLSTGLSELYTGIVRKQQEALEAEEQAAGQSAEQREATAAFVSQMVDEVHGGVQSEEQAVARVHNKCGVSMQDAKIMVSGSLAAVTDAKAARKSTIRTQAEIDAENAKTGNFEALRERCAEAAHVASNLFKAEIGEEMLPDWAELSDDLKNSTRAGAEAVMKNLEIGPEEMHERWMAARLADGWVYGETLDREAKVHPNLRPYVDLDANQRKKDEVFSNAVRQEMALEK